MDDLTKPELGILTTKQASTKPQGCLGIYDEMNGDYDCEYHTVLTCEECKYGAGRKDPDAKCNQIP